MYNIGRFSDRKDNVFLIQLIKESRSEDKQALIQGICEREDFYLVEILIALSQPHQDRWQSELYLRIILNSVFNRELESSLLESYFITNESALVYLLETVGRIRSPLLKAEIFRISAYLPPLTILSPFMQELERLNNNTGGKKQILNVEQTFELENMLPVILMTRDTIFIEPLGRILPHIENKQVVDRIRNIILKLD